MPRIGRLSPASRRWLLWIGIGVGLRLLFIWFPRPGDPDTQDYLELGSNLLHHGIYGQSSGSRIFPSLFRLPGYPIFLATCQQLVARIWPAAPSIWLRFVFVLQAAADIASGLLLAAFARRHISPRAAEFTLALAMICPFTAAYAGIAMTECLSVFAISLGIYAAGRALAAEHAGERDYAALILAGCASGLAMLLRPDGALLSVALCAGLLVYTFRSYAATQGPQSALRHGLAAACLFGLVALLPLVPWTLRNWGQFHVFQPLAPRYLNDPGERANTGFYRWLRTWSVEYVTTATVYWSIGSDPIDLADLPARAFDSPGQREQTLQLIAIYNTNYSISAELDARFAALAAERIRAHPLRYFLVLPSIRITDMLLRPRTEAFYLEVFWWPWSEHPWQTTCAILLGLVNLFYLAAAAWAFLSRRVPFAWMLGGYLLLRFVLLGTMENSEPRYTLECFPILILGAAAALNAIGASPVQHASSVATSAY